MFTCGDRKNNAENNEKKMELLNLTVVYQHPTPKPKRLQVEKNKNYESAHDSQSVHEQESQPVGLVRVDIISFFFASLIFDHIIVDIHASSTRTHSFTCNGPTI